MYAKIIIVGFIFIGLFGIIIGRSAEMVSRNNGKSTNLQADVIYQTCKPTSKSHYDCTDEATKEKAKEIKTWYVQQETKKVTITGYNSILSQTDERPCLAADGSDICLLREHGENTCAYNAPFGTRINVPKLGECIVHDKTAQKYQHRLDWYFGGADQINNALNWGKREKEVTIIYSVPASP